MASVSTLPASAQAASRAALDAAFADQQSTEPVPADGSATAETNGEPQETLEPGEIQEVDMQAQAEGIRTVFSDPTNFNVKVQSLLSSSRNISDLDRSRFSTLCTPLGLCGSILPPLKAVIFRRHLYLRSPKHRCLRRLERPPHWGGWKISSVSSALTASKNFGGESTDAPNLFDAVFPC
jgi:hypothetical protein